MLCCRSRTVLADESIALTVGDAAFLPAILAAVAEFERDAISKRTREALAAAKARGVRLGNYARISKAKQEATRAHYETVQKPIEATADMSANAAAIHLNDCGVTTAAGGAWRAEQILRARRHLEITARR